MYPPPQDEVLNQLEGDTVEGVSFGKHTIHIVFQSGNRLSLACSFRFGSSKLLNDSPLCEFPLMNPGLMRMNGANVKNINCHANGTLELIFTDEDTLKIYANSQNYEDYTLLINGTEYVV